MIRRRDEWLRPPRLMPALRTSAPESYGNRYRFAFAQDGAGSAVSLQPDIRPSWKRDNHLCGREETHGTSSILQTCEHVPRARADVGCVRCRHTLWRKTKIGSYGSRTRACASHVPQTFPRRLRPKLFTIHATVSPIHREVNGVAYRPARRSRPTYGPCTRAPSALRSSRSARLCSWQLDRQSPEDWVMRGAWWVQASTSSE